MSQADTQPPEVDYENLLKTSHGNELAKHAAVRPIVREWVEQKGPLLYFFAPSSTGKTTLAGSLMRHPDYRPTLLIGMEPGETTISEWANNEAACILDVFEGEPNMQRSWIYERLERAADIDCKAIVVEGLISWHVLERSRKLRTAPTATGRALQQLSIEPSMRTSSVLGALYDLKLTRRARGRACPIIVTLNTREVGADDNKELVPGFSRNLVEQARQNADAFIELRRSPTGVSMITQQDVQKHKLRHSHAATLIESQINLTLPGMLALWALTLHTKSDELAQRLTGH